MRFYQGALCGSAGLECECDEQYFGYKECSDLDIGYCRLWWPSGVALCSVFSLETDYEVGLTSLKIPWTEELFAALNCALQVNILMIV